jgi:glycine dehydrogenase
MTTTSSPHAEFSSRHIGLSDADITTMLATVGSPTVDDFIGSVIPINIARTDKMDLPAPLSEHQALEAMRSLAKKNKILISLIGMGYYNCHTPPVIQRNVLENPAWYTAYTPYQPEISQGRLEAILNFQTMVIDLTGLPIANGSLLDEATAAAEAMAVAFRSCKGKATDFIVDPDTHPQTVGVLRTRAKPLGITIVVADIGDSLPNQCFGALLSYPGSSGALRDISKDIELIHSGGGLAIVCCDLLALTLLKPPGEMGADIAIGSTQRFGIPMGFGGPHAAFFATHEDLQRLMPGRLVGVSQDTLGDPAYRLALQTREQHIRREKATSNICTAQVLLAVMAGFYAIWHGPDGLQKIALHIHKMACKFSATMHSAGYKIRHKKFFDTVVIETPHNPNRLLNKAVKAGFNLRSLDKAVAVSFDETIDENKLIALITALTDKTTVTANFTYKPHLPSSLTRNSAYLTHPVFHKYRTETEMMRYMRQLADRDLALDRCMIPLGSCTMKLNATSEMMPITWPEFAAIHPYAPTDQAAGYSQMISELEQMLAQATGYAAVSLQPNAGSQGEFAGLLAISRYHESRGDVHRNICLIPSSAHGTNPASAVLAGLKVIVIKCDSEGNVDVDDLRAKIELHGNNLAALMVTYPSTHGVFEEPINEICAMVHNAGGQVYVDGANLNALVGHCSLTKIGADVSHLNLHKTFCIPHGGGGPGVGPIGVAAHLAPFLPGHPIDGHGAVSSAPYGSAGILPITYMYILMMGPQGLTQATTTAILSANYIATRLADDYPVLYTGRNGRVAHECVIDIRPMEKAHGISNEDIAKRLIDFGFHAPTMSFPVAGTLMIEPTESEALSEIDRFCDAMLTISTEIQAVADGVWPQSDNPLVNAPHTANAIMANQWTHPYSRQQAARPAGKQQSNKYWPPVGRVDNAFGDRNLVCSCPPMDSWEAAAE